LDVSSELADGPLYARVAAVNNGGESLPSPVVGAAGAATVATAADRILIVYAYGRLDAGQARVEDYSDRDLGLVDRFNEPAINDGSYVARLAEALLALGESFDSATLDAVTGEDVALANYSTVIWLAGDDGDAMMADARLLLGLYLDGGGHVIVSGTKLAQQLSRMSPSMLARFGLQYAKGGEFAATASGAYEYLGWVDIVELDVRDTSWGAHQSGAMDWLKGDGAGRVVMRYEGGAAAVAVPGATVFFSFPLENVGSEARKDVLGHALAAVRITDGKLPETDHGCLSCAGGGTAPSQRFFGFMMGAAVLCLTARRRRHKIRRYVK